MTNTFCTIITADYFPKALALYHSIQKFDSAISLVVLLADNKSVDSRLSMPAQIRIIPANALSGYSLVNKLYDKYAHTDIDSFRWSLKPIFISYLLEESCDKVIYVDCDMYFFDDYRFLFADLDHASVLLTPNWINSDPAVNKDTFFSLFTSGLFSAGFIAANKQGLPAMLWWVNACHFMMGEHIQQGIRADQKYLDVFPVKFEGTLIIRHRGCNIGAWNFDESKRELVNGRVLINGRFPIVFIHFDDTLVQQILRGHDKLLLPYLNEYQLQFEKMGVPLSDFISAIDSHVNPGILRKIKWKLTGRSRVKLMLYKLSQKL